MGVEEVLDEEAPFSREWTLKLYCKDLVGRQLCHFRASVRRGSEEVDFRIWPISAVSASRAFRCGPSD